MSVKGEMVSPKMMGSHSCDKCRFKCAEKVSDEERLEIFTHYWNLQSYEHQRDFIRSHVLVRDSVGSPTKKRKQVARTFTLHVKGQIVKVCKDFFHFYISHWQK